MGGLMGNKINQKIMSSELKILNLGQLWMNYESWESRAIW